MDNVFEGSCIAALVLIFGLIIFAIADDGLGEKTIYPDKVTVTDTYTKMVKSGNATITKYYITIQTETGIEEICVTHDLYNKVEKNNEVDVVKTITKTKFTKDTVVSYSIP